MIIFYGQHPNNWVKRYDDDKKNTLAIYGFQWSWCHSKALFRGSKIIPRSLKSDKYWKRCPTNFRCLVRHKMKEPIKWAILIGFWCFYSHFAAFFMLFGMKSMVFIKNPWKIYDNSILIIKMVIRMYRFYNNPHFMPCIILYL